MKNTSRIVGAATILLLAQTLSGHAQLFDFNTPGQLAANFQTGALADPVFDLELFSQSPDGGLENSGSLSVPSFPQFSQDQFWGTNASFVGTTPNTISIYARTPGTIGLGYLGIGMMANAQATGITFPQGHHLGVSIMSNGTNPGSFEIRGEGAFNVVPGNFNTAFQPNTWYRFQISYSHTFNDNYSVQFNAWMANSDGTWDGSNTLTGGTVFAGLTSQLAYDATVHAYFGGTLTEGGFVVLDNFSASAIPEPKFAASLVLLLGGFFLRNKMPGPSCRQQI